ncbi:MAG: serine/threonine protein kinase [Candidatus Bathyarchaeota archaeon]
MSEEIQVRELLESRAKLLLSYPRYDNVRAEMMVDGMAEMGIESVLLQGPHIISGFPVLGKGHTGLVMIARLGSEFVALKLRRVDADRNSLEWEAECLKLANDIGVGPKLVIGSQDLLAMELIEGEYLVDWVEGLGEEDTGTLKGVLRELLVKGWLLDSAGLDHGELSRAYRHIIVSAGGPRIIDFESASNRRRCSNVTSLAQYFFFNRWMRDAIGKIMELPERKILLGALSVYKRAPSRDALERILVVSGLTT